MSRGPRGRRGLDCQDERGVGPSLGRESATGGCDGQSEAGHPLVGKARKAHDGRPVHKPG